MGNISSVKKEKEKDADFGNFYDLIDYIASYYILTMDFKSLRRLTEKEYCDQLVVLTSDIIERYFNDMEVTYLAQRVKAGVEVNDLTKNNIIFLNKDQLESLDVSNDAQKSIKKKRVCIGIAKFYIKIAHIFAAIVKTINPIYVYKDEFGNTIKTPLLEKDKIPKNVKREILRLNICDNRIKALKNNEKVNTIDNTVTMQPKVCGVSSGLTMTLADEPGMTELMQLYLDDKYDYSNGTFTGMSEETKKQFKKDLATFYTAFTGNETMPDNIEKFSDIKLRDYNKKSGCQGSDAALKKSYTVSKDDKAFQEYAENIQRMISSASSKQNELLSVINEIFTYVIDPYTSKKVIRVNPKLTEEMLNQIVIKTRKIIMELYVKCEKDYVNGIKLYEAIVERKILETTQKQIENLKKEANKIIEETKNTLAPVEEKKVVSNFEPGPAEVQAPPMQAPPVVQAPPAVQTPPPAIVA